jgi:hypothetical protein
MAITVKGTVKWSDSEERVTDAVVKAVSKTAPPAPAVKIATTNDDRDFELADLEKGKWELAVLHENATPEGAREFDFQKEDEVVSLDVRRYLGALLLLYAGLHLAFPYRNAPVSELLLGQVDQAVSRAISMPAGANPAVNLQLVEAVAAVKSTWNTISGTQVALGPADREPFRYLEVFFWGLAGILVALILSSGNYLRWRHFYREGIWQHIAQIVTIPLLALVVVLLLSQVTVAITLANSTGLQINLSDPRLLAAVAFLIGVQPWDTWRFVRETAGQITGRQPRQK